MPDIRQHPNYREGFYDAISGEPLFDDADEIYAKGWRAYWIVREALDEWKHNPLGAGSDDGGNIRSSFG